MLKFSEQVGTPQHVATSSSLTTHLRSFSKGDSPVGSPFQNYSSIHNQSRSVSSPSMQSRSPSISNMAALRWVLSTMPRNRSSGRGVSQRTVLLSWGVLLRETGTGEATGLGWFWFVCKASTGAGAPWGLVPDSESPPFSSVLSPLAAAPTPLPWECTRSRECRGSTSPVTLRRRRGTALPTHLTARAAIPSSSQKQNRSFPSCAWITCGQKQSPA